MGGKYSHLENKGFISPFNVNVKDNVTYWLGFIVAKEILPNIKIKGIAINNEYDKEDEDSYYFRTLHPYPMNFLIFSGRKRKVGFDDKGLFLMA